MTCQSGDITLNGYLAKYKKNCKQLIVNNQMSDFDQGRTIALDQVKVRHTLNMLESGIESEVNLH